MSEEKKPTEFNIQKTLDNFLSNEENVEKKYESMIEMLSEMELSIKDIKDFLDFFKQLVGIEEKINFCQKQLDIENKKNFLFYSKKTVDSLNTQLTALQNKREKILSVRDSFCNILKSNKKLSEKLLDKLIDTALKIAGGNAAIQVFGFNFLEAICINSNSKFSQEQIKQFNKIVICNSGDKDSLGELINVYLKLLEENYSAELQKKIISFIIKLFPNTKINVNNRIDFTSAVSNCDFDIMQLLLTPELLSKEVVKYTLELIAENTTEEKKRKQFINILSTNLQSEKNESFGCKKIALIEKCFFEDLQLSKDEITLLFSGVENQIQNIKDATINLITNKNLKLSPNETTLLIELSVKISEKDQASAFKILGLLCQHKKAEFMQDSFKETASIFNIDNNKERSIGTLINLLMHRIKNLFPSIDSQKNIVLALINLMPNANILEEDGNEFYVKILESNINLEILIGLLKTGHDFFASILSNIPKYFRKEDEIKFIPFIEKISDKLSTEKDLEVFDVKIDSLISFIKNKNCDASKHLELLSKILASTMENSLEQVKKSTAIAVIELIRACSTKMDFFLSSSFIHFFKIDADFFKIIRNNTSLSEEQVETMVDFINYVQSNYKEDTTLGLKYLEALCKNLTITFNISQTEIIVKLLNQARLKDSGEKVEHLLQILLKNLASDFQKDTVLTILEFMRIHESLKLFLQARNNNEEIKDKDNVIFERSLIYSNINIVATLIRVLDNNLVKTALDCIVKKLTDSNQPDRTVHIQRVTQFIAIVSRNLNEEKNQTFRLQRISSVNTILKQNILPLPGVLNNLVKRLTLALDDDFLAVQKEAIVGIIYLLLNDTNNTSPILDKGQKEFVSKALADYGTNISFVILLSQLQQFKNIFYLPVVLESMVSIAKTLQSQDITLFVSTLVVSVYTGAMDLSMLEVLIPALVGNGNLSSENKSFLLEKCNIWLEEYSDPIIDGSLILILKDSIKKLAEPLKKEELILLGEEKNIIEDIETELNDKQSIGSLSFNNEQDFLFVKNLCKNPTFQFSNNDIIYLKNKLRPTEKTSIMANILKIELRPVEKTSIIDAILKTKTEDTDLVLIIKSLLEVLKDLSSELRKIAVSFVIELRPFHELQAMHQQKEAVFNIIKNDINVVKVLLLLAMDKQCGKFSLELLKGIKLEKKQIKKFIRIVGAHLVADKANMSNKLIVLKAFIENKNILLENKDNKMLARIFFSVLENSDNSDYQQMAIEGLMALERQVIYEMINEENSQFIKWLLLTEEIKDNKQFPSFAIKSFFTDVITNLVDPGVIKLFINVTPAFLLEILLANKNLNEQHVEILQIWFQDKMSKKQLSGGENSVIDRTFAIKNLYQLCINHKMDVEQLSSIFESLTELVCEECENEIGGLVAGFITDKEFLNLVEKEFAQDNFLKLLRSLVLKNPKPTVAARIVNNLKENNFFSDEFKNEISKIIEEATFAKQDDNFFDFYAEENNSETTEIDLDNYIRINDYLNNLTSDDDENTDLKKNENKNENENKSIAVTNIDTQIFDSDAQSSKFIVDLDNVEMQKFLNTLQRKQQKAIFNIVKSNPQLFTFMRGGQIVSFSPPNEIENIKASSYEKITFLNSNSNPKNNNDKENSDENIDEDVVNKINDFCNIFSK